MSDAGDSDARFGEGDSEDVWPVEPSEAAADVLADPALPVIQFSAIVALTVAIAEDPFGHDFSTRASSVGGGLGERDRLQG